MKQGRGGPGGASSRPGRERRTRRDGLGTPDPDPNILCYKLPYFTLVYYFILYYTYTYTIFIGKKDAPRWRRTTERPTWRPELPTLRRSFCTLIGVPCRLSMLSTFSTFADVLFQCKSPRAEGAKTDPPPGYTYEGTQTTA